MIIYLNGTSSSGKSTIAREIQNQVIHPVFYFSLDTYLALLAPSVMDARKNKDQNASSFPWKIVSQGYFDSIAALHRSGNTVIADCPIYSQDLRHLFDHAFSDIRQMLIVGLDCPLEVLADREKQRGDRAMGMAERQFSGIHEFMKYDLRLESHSTSPAVLAGKILEKLKISESGSFSLLPTSPALECH